MARAAAREISAAIGGGENGGIGGGGGIGGESGESAKMAKRRQWLIEISSIENNQIAAP